MSDINPFAGLDFGLPQSELPEKESEPETTANPFRGLDFGLPQNEPPEKSPEPETTANPFSGLDFGLPQNEPPEKSPEPETTANPFAGLDFGLPQSELPEKESEPETIANPFSGLDFGLPRSELPEKESEPETTANPFSGLDFGLPQSEPEKIPESKPEDEFIDLNPFKISNISDIDSDEGEDDIDENHVFYDSDFIEIELPSDSQYCSISKIQEKNLKTKEWLGKCSKLSPNSSHAMYKAICFWINENKNVFDFPTIKVQNKSYNLTEILSHPAVQQELNRCYAKIWEDSVNQADGTESEKLIKSICITKIIQHLLEFFIISI